MLKVNLKVSLKVNCVLLAAVFIVSCSGRNSPAGLFDNYHYRMSNILDTEIALATPAAAPVYPPLRQLQRPLPQAKINLLEYLRLSTCDLQRLIGQRNSSLGRVMADSQRLIYEVRFIELGRQCLQQLNASGGAEQLQRQLQQAVAEKSASLPVAAWNATVAGEEFARLFSAATVSLDTAAVTLEPSSLLTSLERLQRVSLPLSAGRAPGNPVEGGVRGDIEGDIEGESTAHIGNVEGIEKELAVVGAEKYAGRLLHSMLLAERYLSAINRAMDARLARAPLCINGRPNPRAEVWRTVFYKYYIGQVQPYLAALHQRSAALVRAAQPLLGAFAPLPEPLQRYWQQSFSDSGDSSVRQRFQAALQQHTQLWQRALNQCGMMPGSDAA